MTYPTIKGTSWLVMRVGDPVPVQNYGRIAGSYAAEKARKYVEATPGDYELVEIEHVEREVARSPLARTELRCVNHPDRPSRVNLDAEELCQECADAWARGEGDWGRGRDPDADCLKYRF